jgi:phosphate transport system substrate-binding protein
LAEGNQSMNHNPLRSRFLMTALLGVVLLVAGCSRANRAAITLAGSTSVEPFAERLAELYMRAHPDAKISVQGGGSSAGVRACQSRICAIGMSSRELNPEEKGLVEIPIALDAIALIVNRQNPVRELTMEQAHDIFAGRIRNWQQLGGPNRRITAITREEGSGTRASFEEKVMVAGMPRNKDGKASPAAFAPDALVQDSNGSVREIVASDPAAIGYISSGLIDGRVAAVLLGGVAPTEASIRSGRYPVVRQFLFLTNGEATGTAKAFIDYVLSDSGQNALVEEGLTRVK